MCTRLMSPLFGGTMRHMTITDIQQRLSPVFRAHGVSRAAVFGSVARGEDRPESDVDILVALREPMGLVAYTRFVGELEARLGRRVDAVTERGLNKFIRPYVLRDLKTIYEG